MDLNDLYQEIIIDHNRSPHNFREIDDATYRADGFNPLCGDRLTVFMKLEDGAITDAAFQGSGCAISVASASIMTDMLKGKTPDEAESLFNQFHTLVTTDENGVDMESLGKLAALAGVKAYPARVKCATLCWHTAHNALEGAGTASTE